MHSRPIEEAIIARERQAEEMDALEAAIRKATRITSPLSATFTLAYVMGTRQVDMARMSGYSSRTVRRDIQEFMHYLKIVYRRPDA